MFKKILSIAVFTALSISSYSQSSIGSNWQIGVGGGLVRFSDNDAAFIGDKHLSQVPRFNATRKINNNFSIDAALSFGSFDSAIITNNAVPYFSFDVSGRYQYLKSIDNLQPFVFIGGSLVDSERKMTPTANIGTGVTYWFSRNIGASSQLYYKHSLESFESMRSHIQVTLGVVFGLNFSGRRKGNGATGCYYDLYK